MEKTTCIEAVKESIECLLDDRERELAEDISAGRSLGDVGASYDPAYRDGYAAGYRDLLNDLRNLILHCEYLEESLGVEGEE